jgi:uncharacterized protein (DUF885 family)
MSVREPGRAQRPEPRVQFARRVVCAVAVVLSAGCGHAAPVNSTPHEGAAAEMRKLFAEHAAAYTRAFPDLAEYLGRPLEHHDALPDNSLTAVRAWQAREESWLQRLAKWSFPAGSPEWILHGYLQSTLESSVATRPCRTELWPAHQFGWQTTLLTILEQQPVGTARARAEALTRWGQLPRYLGTEIANLSEGLRLGYTAPRRNVELAIAQLGALLGLPAETSPFGGPGRRDSDPGFRARWSSLVEAELLPATRRYRDFLRDEYAPRARTTLAITGIPQGAECYRGQIKTFTAYQLAPRAIYELGQKAVAEREAKALLLAHAVFGDRITDLQSTRTALETDPKNRFNSGDDALALISQAMARAERAAPRWFSHVPRAGLALVPYADFEAKAHPAARYEPATKDGSRSARFRIDVTNFELLRRADLENTAFHEGIPGHHLQLGLELELPTHHQAVDIRGLGAFFEGWARYAEGLADEMGLYSSDIDRLGAVAHLPTGLVVDPGIHALGWTRETTVAWVMTKQIAFSAEAAEAYVDRIAVCPGEMLSYGFGERDLLDLRREAQTVLGARFDIKAFHDQILAHGALPLPMVRAIITQWLRSQPAAQ